MTASDQPRRRRLPKPATVIAGVALFAAIGGTATAATTLIDGKNIRAGTITAKQVKDGSLGTADLSRAARAALRGARGANGAQGATGAAGPQGAVGPQGAPGAQGAQGLTGPQGIVGPQGPAGRDGVIDPEASTLGSRNLAPGATTRVLSKVLPNARYLVIAKLDLFSTRDEIFGCELLAGADDIDEANWRPAANGLTTPISMQAITPSTTTSVSIECSTPVDAGGAASNVSLIAIPIG